MPINSKWSSQLRSKMERYPWHRITTARSTDEGKTWIDHQVHLKYVKIHRELLTLKNDDRLPTYAARMGKLEGQVCHGIEAVQSHDYGRTWSWVNCFYPYPVERDACHAQSTDAGLAGWTALHVVPPLPLSPIPWRKRILLEKQNIGMVNGDLPHE